MTLEDLGIRHETFEPGLMASVRFNLTEREEMRAALDRLTHTVPQDAVAGPACAIFHFITSVADGSDVEVGFPVTRPVEKGEVRTRPLPPMEVLALVHQGPVETLDESYRQLYRTAYAHGLISDEFCREVFLDGNDPLGERTEIQFVIHRWDALLEENLDRVLGIETTRRVTSGSDRLTLDSTAEDRFEWVKPVVERLAEVAGEDQQFDVLSHCAHVFPQEQIDKLGAVYRRARARVDDPLQAVDAVLDFMEQDAGWPTRPTREGRVIYSAKLPRDRQGYESAQDDLERRQAYCFCPLVRNALDQGMPVSFCYCGSGWFRQQWEGAIGRPVKVEIVESVLQGDDRCRFAIHLPDDL